VLSPPVLLRARQVAFAPVELLERIQGRHDPLVPPRWLRFVGGGDFRTVGEQLAALLRDVGGLRPDEDVLDVGCGVGRLAVGLTGYLSDEGSYEGFDVVRPGIRWCQRHVTPRRPRFRFAVADIANAEYNPAGRFQAREFPFPYETASFDLVVLTSVFTHMRPDEVQHYLGEIRRVLRPWGRMLATAFVVDDEALRLAEAPGHPLPFLPDARGFYTTTPHRPEVAIGYDEGRLRGFLADAGLRLDHDRVLRGTWAGRPGDVDGQDVLLAVPA
jgi:SAM-dependent methyltransferase